jgi:putative glycosyltransferase (TIGR04348 family)
MRICLVTPAGPGSHHGNRVTAERWAGILTGLGHRVEVTETYLGQDAGLLVALHAGKSAGSVLRFRGDHPARPVVLALTGTDLYPDLASSGAAGQVLETADRFVVLQPLAVNQLPAGLRGRARVIYQSVTLPPEVPGPGAALQDLPRAGPAGLAEFDAVVLAHLRPVKDPLLAAAAARLLPDDSPVRIRHAGAVIDPDLADSAKRESQANPHYEWLGEMPRPAALRLLAASRLLVVTSRHEGGANVVSEALAVGIPVIGTRIPGTVGLLGTRYRGYFPAGDAAALARLLARAARDDRGLYRDVRRHCGLLRPLTDPARERESWRRLLAEVGPGSPAAGAARRGSEAQR